MGHVVSGLGYLEKPNPRAHLGGGPMKLYMRRQVRRVGFLLRLGTEHVYPVCLVVWLACRGIQVLELVLKRFGTMEALQEEAWIA